MKVVIYFIDMLRTTDSSGRIKPPYRKCFSGLGHGFLSQGAYSTTPNTAGSLNSFFFGVSSSQNPSKDTDVYPGEVTGLESYLSIAIRAGFRFLTYSPEPDGSVMNFPTCSKRETVDAEEAFWCEVERTQTPAIFMFTDNDYHGTVSDYSATKRGEVVADNHFTRRIPNLVSRCRDLQVDRLLIFSDHGFHGSSDFKATLDPLGPHRTRILWYETDFQAPFEYSILGSPISQLSVNFFSSTLGLPLPSSVAERHEWDLDNIVRDRWRPPFLQLFRASGTSIRWEADYSETPISTELLLLDDLPESRAQSVSQIESKVWSGSFLSDRRVSLVRPQLKARIAYKMISKVQILTQVIVALLLGLVCGLGFAIKDLRATPATSSGNTIVQKIFGRRRVKGCNSHL